jgi:hypothetical protein
MVSCSNDQFFLILCVKQDNSSAWHVLCAIYLTNSAQFVLDIPLLLGSQILPITEYPEQSTFQKPDFFFVVLTYQLGFIRNNLYPLADITSILHIILDLLG